MDEKNQDDSEYTISNNNSNYETKGKPHNFTMERENINKNDDDNHLSKIQSEKEKEDSFNHQENKKSNYNNQNPILKNDPFGEKNDYILNKLNNDNNNFNIIYNNNNDNNDNNNSNNINNDDKYNDNNNSNNINNDDNNNNDNNNKNNINIDDNKNNDYNNYNNYYTITGDNDNDNDNDNNNINNDDNNNIFENKELQRKKKKDPLDNKEPKKTDKKLLNISESIELIQNNENLNPESSNLIQENMRNDDNIVIRRNSENMPLNYIPNNYSFDIYKDLNDIEIVYISTEVDIFRVYQSHDCVPLAFKIYHIENESVHVLFTVNENFIKGKCCQNCHCCELCSFCFCTYLCKETSYFQLNYTKNGKPFLTHGITFDEGCHCCLFPLGFKSCNYVNTLYLRINKNPENPSSKLGIKVGKTSVKNGCCWQSNLTCCDCCFYNVDIYDENNKLKWSIGIKNKILEEENHCKCCNCDCGCCNTCCGECYSDYILGIYNDKGKLNGKIIIPTGNCSRKLEKNCCCKCCCNGCCSLEMTFPYYQIEFPKYSTSLDKFYIITGAIMYEFSSKIVRGGC